MKTYDVFPVVCNNGDIWYFAGEITNKETPELQIFGVGCKNQDDAWTILFAFLND